MLLFSLDGMINSSYVPLRYSGLEMLNHITDRLTIITAYQKMRGGLCHSRISIILTHDCRSYVKLNILTYESTNSLSPTNYYHIIDSYR